ncbi:MAG TPA: hypothetical protein VIH57_13050 [Bacteroidales bacterium]|jgi:hypothetical protein
MNRITKTTAIIGFFIFCSLTTISGQDDESSFSVESGIATNSDNQYGFNIGFTRFEKMSIFLDYTGILNKDGFYYHEISPKFGKNFSSKFIDVSLATGFDVAFYPERKTSAFIASPSPTPFLGIPLQTRLEISPVYPVYFGIKAAYIISATKQYDSRVSLIVFLAVRFGRE